MCLRFQFFVKETIAIDKPMGNPPKGSIRNQHPSLSFEWPPAATNLALNCIGGLQEALLPFKSTCAEVDFKYFSLVFFICFWLDSPPFFGS